MPSRKLGRKRDVNGMAGGCSAARQCTVRVGDGGGAALDLNAVVLEHDPWRVGRRHPPWVEMGFVSS